MLLSSYQARWPRDFKAIRRVLLSGLAIDQVQLEHVRSTAVPDLVAKPIIDMDLVYHSFESLPLIHQHLEQLGYVHRGDQGIAGREVFKRYAIGDLHPILDRISHHLYVCHQQNQELRRHLAFRDYLRIHESTRQEYEALKFIIAEKAGQDRKRYAALKEQMAREFIETILTKAN